MLLKQGRKHLFHTYEVRGERDKLLVKKDQDLF